VFGGLKKDGYVLINTSRSFAELGLEELHARCSPERLKTVPATELALEHLGRPLPNAALLGGFAALTGVVSIDSVAAAIRERFAGDVGERNAAAAKAAFANLRRPVARLEPARA
jgi:pyruvate ferredoxin oxidoreductase gamma subunit